MSGFLISCKIYSPDILGICISLILVFWQINHVDITYLEGHKLLVPLCAFL